MSLARCEDKVLPLLGQSVTLSPAALGTRQWMFHTAGKAKPGEMWMFTAHTGWAGGVAQLFKLSKPSTEGLEDR